MSYDSRIDNTIRRLQREAGFEDKKIDGAWGQGSQNDFTCASKKLAYVDGALKANFGTLNQSQVDGFDNIMNAVNKRVGNANNPLYVAYTLATTWHETATKMKAIAEYGAGKSRRYGKWFENSKGEKYGHRNGNYEYYLESEYPHLYFGRGLPQLTWLDNYIKMGEILDIDLANNPELALNQDVSAAIMIEGMLRGSFTGLSLLKCIRYGSYAEFVYSRRIINGTDKDDLIAKYAVKFLECLTIVEA